MVINILISPNIKQLQRCSLNSHEFPNQTKWKHLWDQGPSCQQRGLPSNQGQLGQKSCKRFIMIFVVCQEWNCCRSSRKNKLGFVDQHFINTKKTSENAMGMLLFSPKTNTFTPSKSMGNPRNPWNPRQAKLVGAYSMAAGFVMSMNLPKSWIQNSLETEFSWTNIPKLQWSTRISHEGNVSLPRFFSFDSCHWSQVLAQYRGVGTGGGKAGKQTKWIFSFGGQHPILWGFSYLLPSFSG